MNIDGSYSNNPFTTTNYTKEEDRRQSTSSTQTQQNPNELSQEERALVSKLSATDSKVKAHEMAHLAASGGLASGASFTYTRGPDNKMYAVAGEVSVSMQKGNTPEETIANARQIRAAAMAPSDPSPQDYKVAANAVKMELEARAQANKIQAEEEQVRQEKSHAEDNEQNETKDFTQKRVVSAYTQNTQESNLIGFAI